MHPPLTRSAHAKINLGLSVLRKRPDGFHDIETIFCPIALADEIVFEPNAGGISLDIQRSTLIADDTNLCVKAAQALRPPAPDHRGVRMTLHKHIPVGAGLGGGSSDAACVLRTLNELWDLRLSPDALHDVASTLGSDVPYFLSGGIAFGSGKGDSLERLPVALPFWVVTVVPPVSVSTPWAYGALRLRSERSTSGLKEAFLRNAGDLNGLEKILVNDFEPSVLAAHTQVRETLDRLKLFGLSCVRMSGSGSSVFGLTSSRELAFRVLRSFNPPFVVSLTPPGRP